MILLHASCFVMSFGACNIGKCCFVFGLWFFAVYTIAVVDSSLCFHSGVACFHCSVTVVFYLARSFKFSQPVWSAGRRTSHLGGMKGCTFNTLQMNRFICDVAQTIRACFTWRWVLRISHFVPHFKAFLKTVLTLVCLRANSHGLLTYLRLPGRTRWPHTVPRTLPPFLFRDNILSALLRDNF